jgi:LysM repeat protein
MRERLLPAVLHKRWFVLAVVGLAVGAAVIGLLLTLAPTPPLTSTSSEPPPQAALSAPPPTLTAVASAPAPAEPTVTTEPGTPAEPSPFAGIAHPPAQPPPRTAPVHHTVAEGEVLWQIAEQYSLRPETVLWANDIEDPDLLLIGQDLLIPPSDGVLYTVRPGDRLSEVATRYGVDVQSIVSSNQLEDADQIQAGVDIFLPGGRPLSPAGSTQAAPAAEEDAANDQSEAVAGAPVPLPDNIDALLGAGWLSARHVTNLYKTAANGSSNLHQLPGGARLERLSAFGNGRIQVRDPGDGRTRQAMTGWVDAVDLDVGRSPATRELPQAYPSDTAMDIFHVFAPYRSQLDGSPYAEANCGPTAVGMALDAFGVSATPRQLRAEALDAQHMYGNGVGTLITALAAVVEEHGLSALDLRDDSGALHRWSLDDLRDQVRQSRPVIVQVRYRSLPGRGGAYYFGDHYVLVTGIVGDGFLYNDPIDIDGLGWDRVISGASLRVAMNASDQRYAYSAVAVGR